MNLKAIENGAEVFERLFVKHGGRGEWYGQEITDLLTGVHEDYLHFVEQRYNPQIIFRILQRRFQLLLGSFFPPWTTRNRIISAFFLILLP